jgi:hypothetical protein
MSSRIIPSLALVVAAAVFFLYVGPTWRGPIAVAKATIASDEAALVAAKEYSDQQNQLAAARDAIDPANLTALATFLPDSVDNVRLILDLNALAARSQFSLSSINVAHDAGSVPSTSGTLPSSGSGVVGSVDLSLSGVGTFNALQDFLSGVEKSARLLDVRDLTVRTAETGIYSYTMVLRLYWLR